MRHTATERAIQSLLGVLNFEAKNVMPGRLFLRRMTDCISGQAVRRKQLQLGAEFHRDLDWWRTNLSGWNGVSAFPPSHDVLKPHIEFATNLGLIVNGLEGLCGAPASRFLPPCNGKISCEVDVDPF
jgi:hypothetical protein